MNYLVLRSFTSYGKHLKKGTVVDESEIRNVKLRRSEKKIYPVVSSSNPVADDADTNPKVPADSQQSDGTPPEQKEEQKINLSFNLNKNLSLG